MKVFLGVIRGSPCLFLKPVLVSVRFAPSSLLCIVTHTALAFLVAMFVDPPRLRHRDTVEQESERVAIRAAGASILRRLIFATSPDQRPAAAGQDASEEATPSCRALLASLHACDGRSEAVRSLSSLGLFGGGNGGADDDDGGGGSGGGGGSRGREKNATGSSSSRKETAREARCRRQLRDDGAAVLVAMVGAVTSATVAAATAASAAASSGNNRGGGGGGSWRQRRRGIGGNGGPGSTSDATGCCGMEGFDGQESEALSAVCVDALRALVSEEEMRVAADGPGGVDANH